MRKSSGTQLALVILFAASVVTACTPAGTLRRYNEETTVFHDTGSLFGAITGATMRMFYAPDPTPEAWVTCIAILERFKKAGLARDYRITVINAPFANAFATSDGSIYITKAMLGFVNSEAELAGVLGHEIGHIEHSDVLAKLDRTYFELGFAPFLTFAHDQEQELAADRFSLELMRKAHYPPGAWAEFHHRMDSLVSRVGVSAGGFLSTHPTFEKRKAILDSLMAQSEKTQEIPESSKVFVAMKERFAKDLETYQPRATSEDEPPRFKSGDARFDRELLEAVRLIKADYDNTRTKKVLDHLKTLAKGNPKSLAAVLAWSGRFEHNRGNYEEAAREFAAAITQQPDWDAPHWLWMRMLAANKDPKRAQDLWRQRYQSADCEKSIACLRGAARTAAYVGFDLKTTASAAEKYRLALLTQKELDPQDQAALSETHSYEILYQTTLSAKLSKTRWELPQGFHPAPSVKDMDALQSDYIQRGLHPPIAAAWGFGFQAGAASYNQFPVLGSSFALPFTSAVLVGDWEFGGLLSLEGSTANSAPYPLASEKTILWEYGLYTRRYWTGEVFRPWSSFGANYATIRQKDATLTSGASLDLSTGFSWRIYRQTTPQIFNLWLVGSVGIKARLMDSYLGTNGSALGYYGALGFAYTFGDPKPDKTRGPAFQEPPVFF